MNKKIQLSLLLVLLGCNGQPQETAIASATSPPAAASSQESAPATQLKEAIVGTWADGTGPTASIVISTDSIASVDQEQRSRFKYELINDSIVIHYQDYDYRAKIKAGKDRLVFEGPDNTSTYTRFKE